MNRLLWKHKGDIAGVILRLAWKTGLKRDEIHNLSWSQIDFDNALINLPDRSVPLDENTAAALESWLEQISAKVDPLEYVVTSPRTKERLTPVAISNTAQRALQKAEIEGIGLETLRLDFIRRMREEQGDVRAMQMSGMTARTYGEWFDFSSEASVGSAEESDGYNEKLWNLLQQNREGAAAIALWLSQQANMCYRQIADLTWDDIDFDKGTVRVGAESRFLLKEIITMLKKEKAARSSDADPHVILSPTNKKPMRKTALSDMLRNFALKNGMGDIYLGEIRNRDKQERELALIRRFADKNGFISGKDAEVKLGLKKKVAYERLRYLVDSGELVRSGKGYVPSERYVSEERRPDAVLGYINQSGYTTISATAERLHLTRDAAKKLLYAMEEAGVLDSGGNHRKFVLATGNGTISRTNDLN